MRLRSARALALAVKTTILIGLGAFVVASTLAWWLRGARRSAAEDMCGSSCSSPGVAVAYGGGDGPDLVDVAALHGMTAEAVVRLHTEPLYTVGFLGFVPGFAYLQFPWRLLALFNLPEGDYKKFHAFLYQQRCNLPVAPYRARRPHGTRAHAAPGSAARRRCS